MSYGVNLPSSKCSSSPLRIAVKLSIVAMPRGEIAEQRLRNLRSGQRFTFRIREGARPGKSERSVTDAINDLHARFDLPTTAAQPENARVILKTNPAEDGGRSPLGPGRQKQMNDSLFLRAAGVDLTHATPCL